MLQQSAERRFNLLQQLGKGESLCASLLLLQTLASTANCPIVAAAAPARGLYTLQFHPEVTHTSCGAQLLRNFAQRVARLPLQWGMQSFLPQQIELLQQQVRGREVIGALSGGVDSTVAAALLHRAIGNRFHGFFIDTGLLRSAPLFSNAFRNFQLYLHYFLLFRPVFHKIREKTSPIDPRIARRRKLRRHPKLRIHPKAAHTPETHFSFSAIAST